MHFIVPSGETTQTFKKNNSIFKSLIDVGKKTFLCLSFFKRKKETKSKHFGHYCIVVFEILLIWHKWSQQYLKSVHHIGYQTDTKEIK